MGYVDLNYKSKDELICRFYLEPVSGVSFEKACEAIAAESSIGTWTDIEALKKSSVKKLGAHVFNLNPRSKIIDVAYPTNAFEIKNVPQILSSVAGNIFGMKDLSNLRLIDISFPKNFIKHQ